MLLALWRSMHAQRGSELGNGTADEHSGGANESLYDPNVAITVVLATPSLTGDQLVVPPGNRVGRFFPSVLISVHSRFPIELNRFQKVRHHQPGPRVRQGTSS